MVNGCHKGLFLSNTKPKHNKNSQTYKHEHECAPTATSDESDIDNTKDHVSCTSIDTYGDNLVHEEVDDSADTENHGTNR